MKFDIKVKDFLAKNKDITVLGLAWACYWRLWAVIAGIYMGAVLVFIILDAL